MVDLSCSHALQVIMALYRMGVIFSARKSAVFLIFSSIWSCP